MAQTEWYENVVSPRSRRTDLLGLGGVPLTIFMTGFLYGYFVHPVRLQEVLLIFSLVSALVGVLIAHTVSVHRRRQRPRRIGFSTEGVHLQYDTPPPGVENPRFIPWEDIAEVRLVQGSRWYDPHATTRYTPEAARRHRRQMQDQFDIYVEVYGEAGREYVARFDRTRRRAR